jgi:hypothetical protein
LSAPQLERPGTTNPLGIFSLVLGLASVFLSPTLSILSAVLAAGLGFEASREIRASAGRESGLWLARVGMVVGMGMAGAWGLVMLVGAIAAKLGR